MRAKSELRLYHLTWQHVRDPLPLVIAQVCSGQLRTPSQRWTYHIALIEKALQGLVGEVVRVAQRPAVSLTTLCTYAIFSIAGWGRTNG
jgi:hypothetical protein